MLRFRFNQNPVLLFVALTTFVAVLSSGAIAEDFDQSFQYDTKSLKVMNLIGEVQVEGHSGSEFIVEVSVRGEDATRDLIDFESDEGRNAMLNIAFPLEDHRKYVYPELGRRSKTSFTPGKKHHGLRGLLGRDKIEVRGSGRGLEMWADVTIRVPKGAELILIHGVGHVEAAKVEGHVDITVRSGQVGVTDVTGSLAVDTGSGHVEVDHIVGDMLVDTGSGHVIVVDAKGDRLSVDTGSGHVEMTDVEGKQINVDTGSGHVELDRVRCENIVVDTGSGQVSIGDLAADDVNVDTGSGSVTVELIEMGSGDFVVDTGSGSIFFGMPEPASATVSAETSSGGIDVDVDGAEMIRKRRDEVEFEVGDGSARVTLDTGSGGIRIASR